MQRHFMPAGLAGLLPFLLACRPYAAARAYASGHAYQPDHCETEFRVPATERSVAQSLSI